MRRRTPPRASLLPRRCAVQSGGWGVGVGVGAGASDGASSRRELCRAGHPHTSTPAGMPQRRRPQRQRAASTLPTPAWRGHVVPAPPGRVHDVAAAVAGRAAALLPAAAVAARTPSPRCPHPAVSHNSRRQHCV
eukprot:60293-Chlamydomonas_euryale.AAC.1